VLAYHFFKKLHYINIDLLVCVRLLQMRRVCPTLHTSRAFRKSRSVHWRTMSGLSTPINRHDSANYCFDCRRCGQFRRTSSNSCSLYD